MTIKGRVVATPDHVCLTDATFVVSDAGLARMRRLGRRKVVAWVEGTWCEGCAHAVPTDAPVVTFNPWRADRFHVAGDVTRVVEAASHVRLESGTNGDGKACPVARVVA